MGIPNLPFKENPPPQLGGGGAKNLGSGEILGGPTSGGHFFGRGRVFAKNGAPQEGNRGGRLEPAGGPKKGLKPFFPRRRKKGGGGFVFSPTKEGGFSLLGGEKKTLPAGGGRGTTYPPRGGGNKTRGGTRPPPSAGERSL